MLRNLMFFVLVCLPTLTPALLSAQSPKSHDLSIREITAASNFLFPTGQDPEPYNWAAPQACQLDNGNWILTYTDKDFFLQILSMSPQGDVKLLRKYPNSSAYAIAAKGNEFALLHVPYVMDKNDLEPGKLFFASFDQQGRTRQRVQLTGTEERKKDRTEFRERWNASIHASSEGYQVFYNLLEDNGKYSGENSRWLSISPEGVVHERIKNYNRDLRNVVGSSHGLEWAVRLPTRNPRAMQLQVYDPNQETAYPVIRKTTLHEITDGQDEETFMCRDAVMAFNFGDALAFEDKVCISYVDSQKKKDYDAGILIVDPASGEFTKVSLPSEPGSQASLPRLGRIGDELIILEKELPAAVDKEIEQKWRRSGKKGFVPEPQDQIQVRRMSLNANREAKLSEPSPLTLNWLNQPANDYSTCVYTTFRDRKNSLKGIRSFQGNDEFLVFEVNEGVLKAWIIGQSKGIAAP